MTGRKLSMGSFLTTMRSSLATFFTASAAARTDPAHAATLEELRDRMTALVAACPAPAGASLARRIRFATEVQTLWFMRSELMALLALTHGEAAARAELAALSSAFRGLLPASLQSRTSFLDSGGHSQPFGN